MCYPSRIRQDERVYYLAYAFVPGRFLRQLVDCSSRRLVGHMLPRAKGEGWCGRHSSQGMRRYLFSHSCVLTYLAGIRHEKHSRRRPVYPPLTYRRPHARYDLLHPVDELHADALSFD